MYLKSAGVQRTIHAEDDVQSEEIPDKPVVTEPEIVPVKKGGPAVVPKSEIKPVKKEEPAVVVTEPETAKVKPAVVVAEPETIKVKPADVAEPEAAKEKPAAVKQEAPEGAKPMRPSRRSKLEPAPSETDTPHDNEKDGKVITTTGDSDNKAKPSLAATGKKNMDKELEETEEEMRAVLENLKNKKSKNPFSQDNESVSYLICFVLIILYSMMEVFRSKALL